MAETLFVADLHLDAGRPAVTDLALRFLEHARSAEALWIIGDLFEAWLGDDAIDPVHEPFIDALAALSDSGTHLHLMHGNRDFLLGNDFARRIDATLHVRDEHVLILNEQPVLLLHGDTLCTGDVDYQALRNMLRDPVWQTDFLGCSPDERREAARALRDQSREAVSGKSGGIMDVDADAVQSTLIRTHCRTMIHGHTHRPDDHDLSGGRRLVVGDWHADHACFVRHDGSRLSLETWR